MLGRAIFSKCKKYRYLLERNTGALSDKRILFIGLNPSTATSRKDDPTIRRCISFAKHFGFGTLWVANIFAYRATDPKKLRATSNPVGPENDKWIVKLAADADLVLIAWGNHGALLNRSDTVLKILSKPMCLGITKKGLPKHPLYVAKGTELVPFFK